MSAEQGITEEELAMLEAVTTEDGWEEACKKIKQVRGGHYPHDWWPKVKLSGMMDRILGRFGGSSEPRIVAFGPKDPFGFDKV